LTRSGTPSSDTAIAAVEAIVKENRRVTVHEIATHLDMSHGSAYHIVHDVPQFHKVSARWVPCQLTAELKEQLVDACQELLKCFEAEGDGFLTLPLNFTLTSSTVKCSEGL
jgi:hypothetical protein